MDANRQPTPLTATEVLRRYKEEDLPEFAEIPLKDVNQAGNTGDRPLHVATTRVNLDEMSALIAGGADVNAHGDLGYTPLHNAAGHGHLEAVKFLLENGASPDSKNEFDESAIDIAHSQGHGEIVGLLTSRRSQS
jgi:ankyrin repeat protein